MAYSIVRSCFNSASFAYAVQKLCPWVRFWKNLQVPLAA